MTAMQGALSAAERSMRSVFVGNIPYEATEEQLKDIFSEVGPVVSFRLVYDRETGKPKGYGFCEYKDQEMALSAMRNLNGYELNGRPLRVDNAASEKSKEELKNLQASLGGPPVESPFGAEVSPDKAPEAIAKIIASLPPEQMYELMTQMKVCIENNPNEARNLLLQNPQLSYALLQCQVVMKIVEPEVAMGMIHRSNGPSVTASGLLPNPDVSQGPPVSNSQMPPVNEVSHSFPAAVPSAAVPPNAPVSVPRTTPMPPSRPSLLGDRPPAMPPPPTPAIGNQFPDRDQRMMGDHDLRQPPLIDHDMRPPPMLAGDKDMRHPAIGDQDFRALGAPPGLPEGRQFNDPRFRNMQGPDMGPGRGPDMGPGRGPDMGQGRGPDMGPGRGHDMGQGRGPDMGPNRGPDMGPGRGSDMGPGRGPDMGPGRGPDMGHGRGPDMGPGRGPDMGSGRGPDMGSGRGPDMGPGRGMDFGPGRGPDMGPGRMQPFDRQKPGMPSEGRPGFDGRGNIGMSPRMEDPRGSNMPPGRMPPQNPRMGPAGSGSPHIGGASPSSMSSPRPGSNPLAAAAAAIAPHDQEKAALIMQVLQLTDQQIAMLHPEQRQSIMVLKEQISRSQQGS